MVVSDALSRFPGEEGDLTTIKINNVEESVQKIHEKLNHRKNIKKELAKIGIMISRERLTDIIRKCLTCCIKDKKNIKTCNFVETNFPGEKVGIDILELSKGKKILVAVDYFSRNCWTYIIKSKEAKNTVKFLTV
jgi:hypothetical protein